MSKNSNLPTPVIVGCARTPVGDMLGALSPLTTVELGLVAAEEALKRAGVRSEQIEEVVCGVVYKAGLKGNPARQIQLVNDFLNISKIHAKGLRASMTSYLLNMPPKQMVAELIAGIKRSEVATKEATSLMDLVEDDYPFVSDPMPNLYFTR